MCSNNAHNIPPMQPKRERERENITKPHGNNVVTNFEWSQVWHKATIFKKWNRTHFSCKNSAKSFRIVTPFMQAMQGMTFRPRRAKIARTQNHNSRRFHKRMQYKRWLSSHGGENTTHTRSQLAALPRGIAGALMLIALSEVAFRAVVGISRSVAAASFGEVAIYLVHAQKRWNEKINEVCWVWLYVVKTKFWWIQSY